MRSRHLPRGAGALLALALLLSGCGADAPAAPPAPTPYPPLRAAGPPCRYIEFGPWRNVETTCSEIVYDRVEASEGAPALLGLALDTDGTLYAAHTARGEIWAQRDADGDGFYEEPFQVAGGLTFPTALTAHQGALYVASVGGLVRLDLGADGAATGQTVLVRDLAGGAGVWPGSVRGGPDGRLWVSTGAGRADDPAAPGMLLSVALDGSDRRVEATGLRAPADFDWDPVSGDLWILDSAGPVSGPDAGAPPDRVYVIPAGSAPPDFGYPGGAGWRPAPTYTLPPRSQPTGLAYYPPAPPGADALASRFPWWEGGFVVALHGAWPSVEPQGYAVGVLMPERGLIAYVAPVSENPAFDAPPPKMSLFRQGFFPYHPADVVIDARGWIVVSVEEGRIFRFRPRPAARAE